MTSCRRSSRSFSGTSAAVQDGAAPLCGIHQTSHSMPGATFSSVLKRKVLNLTMSLFGRETSEYRRSSQAASTLKMPCADVFGKGGVVLLVEVYCKEGFADPRRNGAKALLTGGVDPVTRRRMNPFGYPHRTISIPRFKYEVLCQRLLFQIAGILLSTVVSLSSSRHILWSSHSLPILGKTSHERSIIRTDELGCV